MEETLASPKMAEIDLINNPEKISFQVQNMILKLEHFIQKKNTKKYLFLKISVAHQFQLKQIYISKVQHLLMD